MIHFRSSFSLIDFCVFVAALYQRSLPVPVSCCWNGAVVVKMRAFIDDLPKSLVAADAHASLSSSSRETPKSTTTSTSQGGVVFRRPATEVGGGACDESECTTFCRDLYDRGLQRIYVNPKVRVYTQSCFVLLLCYFASSSRWHYSNVFLLLSNSSKFFSAQSHSVAVSYFDFFLDILIYCSILNISSILTSGVVGLLLWESIIEEPKRRWL